MPLDVQLRRRVRAALDAAPPGLVPIMPREGVRLSDDARRLYRRVVQFTSLGLVHNPPELESVELAACAMMLPMRHGEASIRGPMGVMPVRDRSELAAQRLIEEVGEFVDAPLLDRTTRLLFELPQRPPILEEAKLLADAVNLDDFGMHGLLRQTAEFALGGEGIAQLAIGWQKRLDYGYWQARLNDGFHFEPVRDMARRRLDHARHAFEMLARERREDGGIDG
jgi:hypothetical protein